MTAQPLDPMPLLPEVSAITTYAPGTWGKTLCLATKWGQGDPMPTVCARETHDGDPRHVTKALFLGGGLVQAAVWTDQDGDT